jgi:hypothetical protein
MTDILLVTLTYGAHGPQSPAGALNHMVNDPVLIMHASGYVWNGNTVFCIRLMA